MTLTGDESLVLPESGAPPPDPLPLLRSWLARADELGAREPRAAVLSTDALYAERPAAARADDGALRLISAAGPPTPPRPCPPRRTGTTPR